MFYLMKFSYFHCFVDLILPVNNKSWLYGQSVFTSKNQYLFFNGYTLDLIVTTFLFRILNTDSFFVSYYKEIEVYSGVLLQHYWSVLNSEKILYWYKLLINKKLDSINCLFYAYDNWDNSYFLFCNWNFIVKKGN